LQGAQADAKVPRDPQQAPAIHGRTGRQKVAVQAAEIIVIV
jgi:hypothetical protein